MAERDIVREFHKLFRGAGFSSLREAAAERQLAGGRGIPVDFSRLLGFL
jgi:hypothetical protein